VYSVSVAAPRDQDGAAEERGQPDVPLLAVLVPSSSHGYSAHEGRVGFHLAALSLPKRSTLSEAAPDATHARSCLN